MGRGVGSKEHNCQSEHDTSVDRPHCHPRTSHYENRAGVSLNLVPTRVRVHETFIFPSGESLFIQFSNDKPGSTAPQYQAAWHLLHTTHAICCWRSPVSALRPPLPWSLLFRQDESWACGCQDEACLQRHSLLHQRGTGITAAASQCRSI